MLVTVWVVITIIGMALVLAGMFYQKILGKSILLYFSLPFLAATAWGSFNITIYDFTTTGNKFIFSDVPLAHHDVMYLFLFMFVLVFVLALYYTFQTAKMELSNENSDQY